MTIRSPGRAGAPGSGLVLEGLAEARPPGDRFAALFLGATLVVLFLPDGLAAVERPAAFLAAAFFVAVFFAAGFLVAVFFVAVFFAAAFFAAGFLAAVFFAVVFVVGLFAGTIRLLHSTIAALGSAVHDTPRPPAGRPGLAVARASCRPFEDPTNAPGAGEGLAATLSSGFDMRIRALIMILLVGMAPATAGGVVALHHASGRTTPASADAGAPTARAGIMTAGTIANGRIAFGRWTSAASSDLFSVRPNGSGIDRLTATGRGWTPAWSPDGRRIAFAGPKDAIWIMRANGTHPRQVTHPRTADLSPTWSPDGGRIAFYRFKATTPPTVIFSVRTDGSGLRRLHAGLDPAWSPDGRSIAFSGTDGIWTMRPAGHGARPVVSGDASHPAWSPDGARLTYSSGTDIWVVKVDGIRSRRLTTNRAVDQAPAWSPDGHRIAFARNGAIWTIGAGGNGVRKVTKPGTRADVDPDWRSLHRSPSSASTDEGARGAVSAGYTSPLGPTPFRTEGPWPIVSCGAVMASCRRERTGWS